LEAIVIDVDDSQYNIDLAVRRINSVWTYLKDTNKISSDKVELKAF
jgi:hypothetical protein